MKFFAIYHLPTKQFFPYLTHSASAFDFYEKETRNDGRRRPKPPRLFSAEFQAHVYLREYCKGIKVNDNHQLGPNYCMYEEPYRKRHENEFAILPVTLTFAKRTIKNV